jgi:hypothetical protein
MFSIPDRYNAEKRPFNPPAGRHKFIIPSGYNKEKGFYGQFRLDIKHLSEDLEIHRTYVYKIFTGKRTPSAETLVRLSRKLCIDMDILFQLIQYLRIKT